MPEIGYVNGAIYIYDTKILTLETSLNDAEYGFEMEPEYCVDIDTLDDMKQAEKILQNIQNANQQYGNNYAGQSADCSRVCKADRGDIDCLQQSGRGNRAFEKSY